MSNTTTREYWKVMGGRLKRPRTMKHGTLIEYALAKGYDGDAVGWIFETAKIVAFLRDKGYSVEYQRVDDEEGEE